MSYQTRYRLEWHTTDTDVWTAPPNCPHPTGSKAKFCEECGRSTKRKTLDEAVTYYIGTRSEGDIDMFEALERDGSYKQAWSWRRYEEDMRTMSLTFMNVIFVLYGAGENVEDLWVGYSLNGKWQKCEAKIVYPAVDPEGWT